MWKNLYVYPKLYSIMIVKTKKFQLDKKQYIHFAFSNILHRQWWIPLLLLATSIVTFIYTKSWWSIIPGTLAILYLGFWWIQFYGATQLKQNQLLFNRLSYQISGNQILIALDSKHGMPIAWEQIQYGKHGKDYFLLFLSKAHLIYWPYKIFTSPHEIQFVTTLLKRKKLIK